MDVGDGEVNFLCLCVTKCVYDINVTESVMYTLTLFWIICIVKKYRPGIFGYWHNDFMVTHI